MVFASVKQTSKKTGIDSELQQTQWSFRSKEENASMFKVSEWVEETISTSKLKEKDTIERLDQNEYLYTEIFVFKKWFSIGYTKFSAEIIKSLVK